ncbi:transposase [Elusimicrobiota bacterium]
MPAGPPAPTTGPPRYRGRDAAASPLYGIVQDHLEDYIVSLRAPSDRRPLPHPAVENSLRSFLECGIPRFGVVRFRCEGCGHDLFVPFSCKRRGVCPSCDAKRAVAGVAYAADNLLPEVPYRQWVLVVPKRIRYFLHRRPEVAGELSRILARAISRHLEREAGPGSPAQIQFIQRFGESLNLHLHVHAVISEGVFSKKAGPLVPGLAFHPADPPSEAELHALTEEIRRKVLKRFTRLGVIPEETATAMLSWPHSGFSLHARVAVAPGEREGLERLLRYCARPALSIKRLRYNRDKGLAIYRTDGRGTGKPKRLEMEAVEFLRRFALLAPPPKRNTVRYYGVLAPSSPLRPLIVHEAQQRSGESNRARLIPALKTPNTLERAKETIRAYSKSWAACLSRIFEIEPLVCPRCAGALVPVAAIFADHELTRLLEHLKLPTEFPKTALPRGDNAFPMTHGPPESQLDPLADQYLGIDEDPNADFLPA